MHDIMKSCKQFIGDVFTIMEEAPNSVLNVKALEGTFNLKKALLRDCKSWRNLRSMANAIRPIVVSPCLEILIAECLPLINGAKFTAL